MHEETDEENCTAPIRRFDGDVTSRGLDRLLEGGHGRAPRKGSVHRTQSSGDGFDAALAVNFRCSRWTKVFTKQCLALGVALWVPRSRWLLDWWREQQTAYPWIATPVARHDGPSRCPNCGFASLFLYPFLLSRTRVGVWDTSETVLYEYVGHPKPNGSLEWSCWPASAMANDASGHSSKHSSS